MLRVHTTMEDTVLTRRVLIDYIINDNFVRGFDGLKIAERKRPVVVRTIQDAPNTWTGKLASPEI